jgi:hypothetical protein
MTNATDNARLIRAALQAAHAVAELIQTVGEIPSGELYARLCGKMDLSTYQSLIGVLKGSGLVRENGMHLLIWAGPAQAKEKE